MGSRVLYMLWDRGLDAAPPLVQVCVARWKALNPDWDVRLKSGDELDAWIAALDVDTRAMPIQKKANLYRLGLLRETGGVWADATLYPTRPLSDFLPPLVGPSGFFAFVGSEMRRPMDNWVLAAAGPGHLLVERSLALYADYWRSPRRRPRVYDLRWLWRTRRDAVWSVDPAGGRAHPASHYFAFQFHFAYLLRSDPDFAALWDRTPKRSGLAPLLFKRASKSMPLDVFLEAAPSLLDLAPMHKMTWKKPPPAQLLDFLAAYPVEPKDRLTAS